MNYEFLNCALALMSIDTGSLFKESWIEILVVVLYIDTKISLTIHGKIKEIPDSQISHRPSRWSHTMNDSTVVQAKVWLQLVETIVITVLLSMKHTNVFLLTLEGKTNE